MGILTVSNQRTNRREIKNYEEKIYWNDCRRNGGSFVDWRNIGICSMDQKDIGAGEAKKIAYEDAGISESDVERVHVLKDRDDGRLVYEIGFVEADYQYNYEIAASNGKILDKEIEQK